MKRKWWLAAAAVIASLGISLCFFGVRVRVAPRLVLYGAMNDAFGQLESSFENSPVHMLADVYDPEGHYQADLQLQTNMPLVGLVRYDMDMQVQLAPRRILGSGTVVAGKKALDLSVYLDGDFAAVSSDSLVKGNYYGICYDTFSRDVRDWEVLTMLIGKDTITGWENSVSSLDTFLSGEPRKLNVSSGDIRAALYAVLTLDPQVSTEKIQHVGEKIKVHTISFRATGQQIAKAAKPHQQELTPQLARWIEEIKKDPEFYVEAVFYLDRGTLIRLDCDLVSAAYSCRVSACLGRPDEKQDLSLELEIVSGADLERFELSVENGEKEAVYQEKISFIHTKNGRQESYGVDYTYDLSSGEMDLKLTKDAEESQTRMHMAAEGEKLTITTQNITPLVNLFREKPLKTPMICTVSIMQGQEIAVPEYRNLDQWSLEDLWPLVKGIGGLIGINL